MHGATLKARFSVVSINQCVVSTKKFLVISIVSRSQLDEISLLVNSDFPSYSVINAPIKSTFLFSACRRGTAAEHALLLACLFLGFHLEAYVVLGEVDGEKSYSVLTVEQAEGWIWDPCSGTRKSWGEPTAGLWIHTVFNNEGCWTPRQRDARPSTIGFRVRDPQWGSLPEEVVALPSLHLYPRDFSLQAWPPSLTEEQAEQGVA